MAKCSYTRKAEGDLRHRGEVCVKTKARDCSYTAHKPRMPEAIRNWRRQGSILARASGGRAALATT